MRAEARVTCVVACFVALCMRTILKTSRLGSFPSKVAVWTTFVIFFMKFSARPLPCGCSGTVGLWLMSIFLQYLAKSSDE